MAKRELIDNDERVEVGARLAYIRENLNLTRRDISESIFTSPQTIGNIERGNGVSKNMCHHLWLVYSDYFYISTTDPSNKGQIMNASDIQSDLDYIENYLYGKEG